MTMKRRTILAAVFALAANLAHASETPTIKSRIQGVVIDEAGIPVHLASVMAWDMDHKAPLGVVEVCAGCEHWFETDEKGQFVMRGLIAGHHYKVFTWDEEAGYPNTEVATYNPKNDGPVVVASDAPRGGPDVRLQLGPKAVILRYKLKDAITGKRLDDYSITVTRVDTNYTFGGTNSEYKMLLPADTDMKITFEVKGYQAHTEILRDHPGIEKHLDVLLTPENATQ